MPIGATETTMHVYNQNDHKLKPIDPDQLSNHPFIDYRGSPTVMILFLDVKMRSPIEISTIKVMFSVHVFAE